MFAKLCQAAFFPHRSDAWRNKMQLKFGKNSTRRCIAAVPFFPLRFVFLPVPSWFGVFEKCIGKNNTFSVFSRALRSCKFRQTKTTKKKLTSTEQEATLKCGWPHDCLQICELQNCTACTIPPPSCFFPTDSHRFVWDSGFLKSVSRRTVRKYQYLIAE